MKKALLASTAIVAAAALASPANAADRIKLSVGGFMEQYIGFADNEDDAGVRNFATFDTQSDSEIYFSGSTTLDNGIKLAVRVELEGDQGNASIDESWLNIQTAWGSFRIGGEDAMTDLQAIEPRRGISGDHDNWIVPAGINRAMGDDTYVTGASGDNNMIHYLTPSLAGFQAGVSYHPEVGAGATSTMPNRVTGTSSATSATLNWSGSFADVGIDAGYGYYTEGGNGSRTTFGLHGHNVGVNVSFAGFGIGGSYGRQMGNHVSASDDGWGYKAGLWYGSGPIAVGFYHHHSSTEQAAGGGEDEQTVNSVWFNYTISDGVRWESMVFHTDYDSPKADAAFNSGGFGIVGGLRLDF